MKLQLPASDQRQLIVGSTGSGKTVAALWQLSLRDFDTKPWIVIDFKKDVEIASIEGAQYLPLTSNIPDEPGIYIIQPAPHEADIIDDLLWNAWAQENVGIFIDELYMVNNSDPLRAVLTQGRSKNIPMIMLTQRPRWISRFAISEAEFLQVFRLGYLEDRKYIAGFLPDTLYNPKERLDPYHSVYYDVPNNTGAVLGPVPVKEIQPRFAARLKKLKERLDPPRIEIEAEKTGRQIYRL